MANLPSLDDWANQDTIKSKANAALQGAQLGVDNYGSTISKAILKGDQLIGSPLETAGQGIANLANKGLSYVNAPFRIGVNTPQSIQSDYEQNIKDTAANPDVQAHPFYAAGGQLAGNLAMTAPIMAVTGVGSGPLLQQMADYGTAGLLQGGLFNQPGQGTNIVNPTNALIGAGMGVAGGALNTGVQKYLQNINETPLAQKAIQTVSSWLSPSGNPNSSTASFAQQMINPSTGMININATAPVVQDSETSNILKGLNLAHSIWNTVKQPVTGYGAGAAIGGFLGGTEGAKEGGTIGAGIGLGGKILMSSPAAISKIMSYSPLKNSLLFLNKMGSQVSDNPEIATWFASKVAKQMTGAGINSYLDSQGNTNLHTQAPSQPSLDDWEAPVNTTGIRG